MGSASTLRRYRLGFLIVAIVALLASGALFSMRRAPEAPPGVVISSASVGIGSLRGGEITVDREPHEHKTARPLPKTDADAPAPTPSTPSTPPSLSTLTACASLCTATIALLGFLVTSVMTVRKERRDSALFAIDLETKRLQLAEIQAKVARATEAANA
jgi:hypothetical protein